MNGQLPQTPSDEERRAALQELAEKYHIADVNAELPGDTDSHLMAAAEHADQLDLMKLLITAGADVNRGDDYGCTALCIASESGNVQAVKLLLEAGANVNVWGMTPLMSACAIKDAEIVALLLAAGAEVNLVDLYDCTAMDYAVNNDAQECIKLLSKHGGKRERELLPLKWAVCRNDLDEVKRLMDSAYQPGLKEIDDLSFAVFPNWNTEILRLLLPCLEGPSKGMLRTYILSTAAAENQTEYVRVLLEAGVDPNGKDANQDDGEWVSVYFPSALCPLRAAVRGSRSHQSYACVRLLLEYGARPDLPDENGITPLEWAEREGNEECAELLRAAMK